MGKMLHYICVEIAMHDGCIVALEVNYGQPWCDCKVNCDGAECTLSDNCYTYVACATYNFVADIYLFDATDVPKD